MPLRTSFAAMNCSLARAIDVVGDAWSLLILRECFLGVERFDGFHRSLGMARNILADRLARLVAAGVLERSDATRPVYRLSEQGRDLLPALIALMQWGDRWISGAQSAPMLVLGDDGEPLATVALQHADGSPQAPDGVGFAAGPGAEPLTRAYLEALASVRRKPGDDAS